MFDIWSVGANALLRGMGALVVGGVRIRPEMKSTSPSGVALVTPTLYKLIQIPNQISHRQCITSKAIYHKRILEDISV